MSDLMDVYGQGIWSYVFSITKDGTTTDDISQEVFIQAFQHLHRFRNESSVKTWLYAIAKNKCKDHFRSAFVRRVTISNRIESPPGESVEDVVMQSMQRNAVWEALLKLKQQYREVVILHTKEDMTFKEVGDVMGLSESTARVKYHRAVRQLRDILGKELSVDGVWGNA